MKTILKTICESAFHTKETNNLNVFGIYDTIWTKKFPAVHPRMSFVLIVGGKPNEKFSYHIEIEDGNGAKILDGSSHPQEAVVGNNGKIHLVYNVLGIKFTKEGRYRAHLYAGDIQEALDFDVRLAGNMV